MRLARHRRRQRAHESRSAACGGGIGLPAASNDCGGLGHHGRAPRRGKRCTCAVSEYGSHGRGPCDADRAVCPRQRCAVQSGCFIRGGASRAAPMVSLARLRRDPDPRVLRRSVACSRDVRASRASNREPRQNRGRSMARRSSRYLRSCPCRGRQSQVAERPLDGGGVDRSRVLVHRVDLIRKSGHNNRPIPV
jgi:hypothetical protein